MEDEQSTENTAEQSTKNAAEENKTQESPQPYQIDYSYSNDKYSEEQIDLYKEHKDIYTKKVNELGIAKEKAQELYNSLMVASDDIVDRAQDKAANQRKEYEEKGITKDERNTAKSHMELLGQNKTIERELALLKDNPYFVKLLANMPTVPSSAQKVDVPQLAPRTREYYLKLARAGLHGDIKEVERLKRK